MQRRAATRCDVLPDGAPGYLDAGGPVAGLADGLILDGDGRPTCFWGGSGAMMAHYHDTEWGFPVAEEHLLFEKICLEGFQSGLSWRTVLAKRPAFREVFHDFHYEAVARMGDADVERLLRDARIIRHRGKIAATLNNARRACELAEAHGSLGAFVWRYAPAPGSRRPPQTRAEMVSTSTESSQLAKDLKKQGWRFFGPTTAYAFMQAMGMVDDHLVGCHVREACEEARAAFVRPS